jgi:hypothetical protein
MDALTLIRKRKSAQCAQPDGVRPVKNEKGPADVLGMGARIARQTLITGRR